MVAVRTKLPWTNTQDRMASLLTAQLHVPRSTFHGREVLLSHVLDLNLLFWNWPPRTPLLAFEQVIIIKYGLRPPPGQKTDKIEESCFLCRFFIDFQSIFSVIGRRPAANGHSVFWLVAIDTPSRSRTVRPRFQFEELPFLPTIYRPFSSSIHLSLLLLWKVI